MADDGASVFVVGIDGKVFGVDPATGRSLWVHDVGGWGPVELAIGDDRVFAISVEPKVTCIEYPGGRLLGSAKLPRSEPGGRLLIEGRQLYVAGAGEVTCVSEQGQVLWTEAFSENRHGRSSEIEMGFPHNIRHVDRSG